MFGGIVKPRNALKILTFTPFEFKIIKEVCWCGGIGRHKGLKIPR